MLALLAPALLSSSEGWRASFEPRYDAIVLGSGLKECLLASMLTSRGKRVLQIEQGVHAGGESSSLDLRSLYEQVAEPGESPEPKLGPADEYRVDLTPKVLMASGDGLQSVVNSRLWQHIDFRRVHRSFIYRRRPDGEADVHRILASVEDVMKTRMLPPLEKARVVQLFMWLEQFDEAEPATHVAGRIQKRRLNVHRLSAAAFFKFWEVQPETIAMLVRGMAGFSGPMKSLRKVSAAEIIGALKAYKDSYRTFPHMTSPYVFPSGGVGAALAEATATLLKAGGGASVLDRPVDEILLDDDGAACGVSCEGVQAHADVVIASPPYAPDRVTPAYYTVRLYAILNHPPHKCKDAPSCHLLLPASQTGRRHDTFLFSSGPAHKLTPRGKWLVTLSTRVEGPIDGLKPLEVAKREMAAAMPLLRPIRKMLARVEPVFEVGEAQLPPGLHVLSSCDESTFFEGLTDEVIELAERLAPEADP